MTQPILIDSASFLKFRKKGCVYVDKTAYLHRLISAANSCFFLARPRRFGKSLMLSTLKAIFQGKRELFQGLAIDKTDWTWEKYPVLHFDFSFASSATSAEEFAQNFPHTIKSAIVETGGTYKSDDTPEANFGRTIDELSMAHKDRTDKTDEADSDKGVVILIDEYDDPVARLLHKPDEAEKVREKLASFYGQMKGRTDKIRFLMITGVSKFTKMSVVSALSNLVDLSFRHDVATMLGYSEEELDAYFGEHMRAHAEKMGLDDGTYRAELKWWFNGYRFGRQNPATVYNPVSIGNNLESPENFFQPCWADTGKASMLMNFLKRGEFLSHDLDTEMKVLEQAFDVTNIHELRTIPMLFQTGYLTIGDFDSASRLFTLRVPDEEVREDLASLTASVMAQQDVGWVATLGGLLLGGEWDKFLTGLKSLYAGLPYGPTEAAVHECSFERVLMTFLRAQGVQCTAEDRQASGQADVVATHPCGVYIFELKVDESAEAALAQVKQKGYDAPYRAADRPVWAIGLNFDRQTRQLMDAKFERL